MRMRFLAAIALCAMLVASVVLAEPPKLVNEKPAFTGEPPIVAADPPATGRGDAPAAGQADNRVDHWPVPSVEKQVGEAQVIVVAIPLGSTPVQPKQPGDAPEVAIRWQVKRVLKGAPADKVITTRNSGAPAGAEVKELAGKEWILLLSPDFMAGKYPYAAIMTVKEEQNVRAILSGAFRLVNEKPVFTGEAPAFKRANQYARFSMRLSPDGRHLLYPRPKGELPPDAKLDPKRSEAAYELVLREIATGKETVLPLSPTPIGGTGFNPFDKDGQRLLLPETTLKKTQEEGGGVCVQSDTKWIVFAVQTGKVVPGGIAQSSQFARFANDGKRLIGMGGPSSLELSIATPGEEPKPLKAKGFPNSICPTDDVICVWTPPERKPGPVEPGKPPERSPQRLFLYSLKADKEIVELPVHERNSQLDDWETQWSPDGRYLAYHDLREPKVTGAAPATAPSPRPVTRIWDRKGGKPAGEIAEAIPVGPGPTPGSIWLAKRVEGGSEGGIILYDAEAGKEYSVADSTHKLIHASGRKLVYLKQAKDGPETAYTADVATDAAAARK